MPRLAYSYHQHKIGQRFYFCKLYFLNLLISLNKFLIQSNYLVIFLIEAWFNDFKICSYAVFNEINRDEILFNESNFIKTLFFILLTWHNLYFALIKNFIQFVIKFYCNIRSFYIIWKKKNWFFYSIILKNFMKLVW